MIRALIDSNVIISGLLFEGNENRLLELGILQRVVLLVPEHVFLESERVLKRKQVPSDLLERFHLCMNACVVVPFSDYKEKLPLAQAMIRDPKDAFILAAVLSVSHDFFVSGDKDFQVLQLPTQIPVRNLIEFLKGRNKMA